MHRNHLRLLGAATALFVLGALDFILPSAGWYAAHPMTAAAVATVFGFVAAAIFLDDWLRDRECRRLAPVSKIAYRSLAQSANDSGRALLAELNGADLFALGLPHRHSGSVEAVRDRLTRVGAVVSTFTEQTGSWVHVPRVELDDTLRCLLRDPQAATALFRTVALERRRLQDATALWAPVMLTSTHSSEDLGRLSELTDSLEMLQEELRRGSPVMSAGGESWLPRDAWVDRVSARFWLTINEYEAVRDQFGDLALLPSDRIVNRRAGTVAG